MNGCAHDGSESVALNVKHCLGIIYITLPLSADDYGSSTELLRNNCREHRLAR